tara:strand:+ start:341 stop:1054 length:714 start_codon:yes stop_codon:yes gene_type:complete
MNNNLLQIKVQQRLNKLASEDYDNIECWQIQEAFNKAQLEFCRRQIHGNNQRQEGDESTKMLIDDMQKLLSNADMTMTYASNTCPHFYQTQSLFSNYLYFKRMEVDADSECCGSRCLRVHLEEVADVDELLADELSKPSIEWGETFCTMADNKINIYTDGTFNLKDAKLHYYRRPVDVEFDGCINPATDAAYTADVECEFKDDIAELIIDETVAILAGDIELFNNYQRSKQNATMNN